jgi:hypothetical protein
MTRSTAGTFLQTLKVLCAALMSSLVLVLIAVSFVLAEDGTGTAPVWAYAVVAVVAAVDATLTGIAGYRFRPLAPGTPEEDARRSATAQVQTLTILRFALSEAVALAAVALAFVVEEGGIPLVALGVLIAEVLMSWHVWPSERVITRSQEALEREGARSYLREALASPPPSRG